MEIRGNYPSVFAIEGNKEIDKDDILRDEINIQKLKMKRCRTKNKT